MTMISCKKNISTDQNEIVVAGHKFKKAIFNDEPLYIGSTIDSDGYVLESTFKLIEKDSLLVHGFIKSYHKNGSLRYYTNVSMGENCGSNYIYRENGTIDNYQFYDPKGNLRLFVEYDENGNALDMEELSVGQTILIVDDTLQDSIEVEFLAPDIPHFDRQLTLLSKKCDHEKIQQKIDHGENSLKLLFAKDTCDWVFQMRYYFQDSIVFGEEGIVFSNVIENVALEDSLSISQKGLKIIEF